MNNLFPNVLSNKGGGGGGGGNTTKSQDICQLQVNVCAQSTG